MTTIRVADVRYPVTTLGPGRRLVVWVQGCHLACPGCMSTDTWEPMAVFAEEVEAVVARCSDLVDEQLDGVTISGGEPFEQPDGLRALVTGLRGALADREIDVLVYSGFTIEVLRHQHSAVLSQIDGVIAGRYLAEQPTTAPWRGSDNQQLVALTALGRARYGHPAAGPVGLQVQLADGKLHLIGVPRPGDLERLQAALADSGVHLREATWRM